MIHVITGELVTFSSCQEWIWMMALWGWWCFGIQASPAPLWRSSSPSCCAWIRCQVTKRGNHKSKNKSTLFIYFKMCFDICCMGVFYTDIFKGKSSDGVIHLNWDEASIFPLNTLQWCRPLFTKVCSFFLKCYYWLTFAIVLNYYIRISKNCLLLLQVC